MARHKNKNAAIDLSLDTEKQLIHLKNSIKSTPEISATGVLGESDLFHYGPPVSPKEFIESPEYYGNKEKQNIYPWIIDDLTEVFSGQYYAPKYQTVVELLGTGSGKSYFAGLADAYMIYWLMSFKSLAAFFKTKNISWDDTATIAFMNMAPRAEQAKGIVFERVKQVVGGSKIFQERNWLPNPNIKNELQFESIDPKTGLKFTKVQVIPGNSSATFSLGYNIFGGIIDEANFFAEKNTNPVVKIYEEMSNRRQSRFQNLGLMILTSSANLETDITEELIYKAKTDPSIFCRRRSRYECKPEFWNSERFSIVFKREKTDGTIEDVKLSPPKVLEQQYIDNKAKALRDIDAIPALASQPFYADGQLLISKFNMDRNDPFPDRGLEVAEGPADLKLRIPNNFKGVDGATYRIHVDLAKGNIVKNHCGVGFAMSHKMVSEEGFKIKLDAAVRFKAPHDQEAVDIGALLDLIKYFKVSLKFNIDMVTFDQYQSLLPRQTIEKWGLGISTEEIHVGYEHHSYLKTLIMCNQFDAFYDQNLIYELKRLEEDGKYVYPAIGSFMDESDAVAGSAYANSGALESKKKEEEEKLKPRASQPATISRPSGNNPFSGVSSVARYRQNYTPKYHR